MSERVRSGSDVEGGVFRCTNCGFRLEVVQASELPPCPECQNGKWAVEHGVEGSEFKKAV